MLEEGSDESRATRIDPINRNVFILATSPSRKVKIIHRIVSFHENLDIISLLLVNCSIHKMHHSIILTLLSFYQLKSYRIMFLSYRQNKHTAN